MYYSAIKYNDIANGLGVRTVLFVSGCRNRCEGCFQPETWNFQNGKFFDESVCDEIYDSLKSRIHVVINTQKFLKLEKKIDEINFADSTSDEDIAPVLVK